MKKMFTLFAILLCTAESRGAQEHPISATGVSTPAHATTEPQPRHIDFTAPLKDFSGKVIMVAGADGKTAPMTLGDVAINALESITDDDRKQGMNGMSAGEEKFKRDVLAGRVFNSKDVVLRVEEIALIKERIGEVYGAIIVGAAWRILDPAVK